MTYINCANLYKMTDVFIPDDVWGIVKEFMLDWFGTWKRNMKLSLEPSIGEINVGIKCPRKFVGERYDMINKLYYSTFVVRGDRQVQISSEYINYW